jgi:glyoxylase-like metal-dependent hydrolase (beta-lactamase superfamily II)
MHSISRRGFVISTTVASAAFGLNGPLELIGTGFAQSSDLPFVKFRVGDLEVIQLNDGVWEKTHDPGFIKNASVDETKAALRAGGLTDVRISIPFTVTLVKIGGSYVMFDAGTGAQVAPTAGLIVKQDLWKIVGIDPKQINYIVVSHFHPDHIFGLIAKDTNAQIFPNSQIIMPEKEYKYWTDPALIEALPEARQGVVKRIQGCFPGWKNITQVPTDTKSEVLPGVRPINTNGHTPGHTSYLVSSGGKQIIVGGDVTYMPALFVRNPDWQVAFDQDAQMAQAARLRMFDRVVADKSIIAGYHYGLPGAGTILKDGKGYAYVPIRP